MPIGAKIKMLRIQHGLTQEELANRCELSKGFISLPEFLEERYGETIVIQIGPASEEPVTEVVIPVTPPRTGAYPRTAPRADRSARCPG